MMENNTFIEQLDDSDGNSSLPEYNSDDYCTSINDGISAASTRKRGNAKKVQQSQQEQGHYQQQQQQQQQQPVLSQRETKNVRRLRLGVVIILVLSAVTAGGLSFWYLSHAEQIKFKSSYEDNAHILGQSLYSGVMNTFATLDLLATVMVTHASASNEIWPYQTLPNYANIVAKMLSGSAGITIWSMMLLTNGTDQRKQWEEYAKQHLSILVNETIQIMETDPNYHGTIPYDVPIINSIHDGNLQPVPYNESRPFAPISQMYPIQSSGFTPYNWDWFTYIDPDPFIGSISTKRAVLGEPYMNPDVTKPDEVKEAQYWADTFSGLIDPDDEPLEPASDILYPVINRFDRLKLIDTDNTTTTTTTTTGNNNNNNDVVAVLSSSFYWRDVMKNVLPEKSHGLIVVIENSCTAPFTYQINGPKTKYLGRGDLHDKKYDTMAIRTPFYELDLHNTVNSLYTGVPLSTDYCRFMVTMYPSQDMEEEFTSANPGIFAAVAVLIFVFTTLVFAFYDKQVEHRQQLVMTTAVRTTAVLSSLFPTKVRDQLLWEDSTNNGVDSTDTSNNNSNIFSIGPGTGGFGFGDVPLTLNPTSTYSSTLTQKFASPIADLYPETTVFFADICGFTAWSSSRGPDHVFVLLESLYSEFDKIARRRKVFKVETIGDSYLAVAGLPDPMKYHAQIMVKFSEDILKTMKLVVTELSRCFGPDTLDLQVRVGLNSGPTTAGVIRGEKSRFQLFGDTVNTASRMESTGVPGKIQCSPKTAELLRKSGKEHWLTKRDDVVRVKGKGEMTTYWVQTSASTSISSSSSRGSIPSDNSVAENKLDSILQLGDHSEKSTVDNTLSNDARIIDWTFEIFQNLLLDVMSIRAGSETLNSESAQAIPGWESKMLSYHSDRRPLDEVVEVFDLPDLKHTTSSQQQQHLTEIRLESEVSTQLRQLLSAIASLYRQNPFHNFDHASHVVMSTKNLLDRIVLDNTNFGHIKLDPLVRLAIVFGALIHDVDHSGVPNCQLTKEKTSSAIWYKDRCVAEQNSFDVAFKLFMQPQYSALRRCIFHTEDEWKRFRQVALNVVIATDIFDNDLKTLRESRWDKMFGGQSSNCEDSNEGINEQHDRLATVCIEHLIQASDVIHTMQHWHIYQKWNRKLFQEMNMAHQQGRWEKNPCSYWYESELLFFDNYIIPLANKLKVCGVFGANSAAFLDFATDNRMEWESKGQTIVSEWIEELNLFGENDSSRQLIDI